jgi:hypothetical protein
MMMISPSAPSSAAWRYSHLLRAVTAFEPDRRLAATADESALADYSDDAFPRGGCVPDGIVIETLMLGALLFLGASREFRDTAVPIVLTDVSFHRRLRPHAGFTVEEHLSAQGDQTAVIRAVGSSEGTVVVEAEFIMGFGNGDERWPVPPDRGTRRDYFRELLSAGGCTATVPGPAKEAGHV